MNEQTQPLAIQSAEPEPAQLPIAIVRTAQEMRVTEVSEALTPAYQKAGTLEMSDQEIADLTAPFADEYVEIRPHDGLIYIPHIHISDRLNKVFKPGKWVLLRRRDWFDDVSKTMFAEYVLIVRGCLVGESVGGHPYVASNPKQNLSDVLESTAAEALRRICGKRLSCGSQVWNPEYARQWVKNYGVQIHGKWQRRFPEHEAPPPIRHEQPVAEPEPPRQTNPVRATPKTRARMLSILHERFTPMDLNEFVTTRGYKCEVNDWPLEYVPTSKPAMDDLVAEIEEFVEGLAGPFSGDPKVEHEPSFWTVPIVVPRAGMKRADYAMNMDTIRSLYDATKAGDDKARTRLFGLVSEWRPGANPTREELDSRKAMDEFMAWRQNSKEEIE